MTRRSPRLSGSCGTWSDAGWRYRLAASSRWSGRRHVISSPGRQETRGRPVTRTSPTPNIPLWARYGSRTGSSIGDHKGGYARLRAEGRLRIVKPPAGAGLRADGASPTPRLWCQCPNSCARMSGVLCTRACARAAWTNWPDKLAELAVRQALGPSPARFTSDVRATRDAAARPVCMPRWNGWRGA